MAVQVAINVAKFVGINLAQHPRFLVLWRRTTIDQFCNIRHAILDKIDLNLSQLVIGAHLLDDVQKKVECLNQEDCKEGNAEYYGIVAITGIATVNMAGPSGPQFGINYISIFGVMDVAKITWSDLPPKVQNLVMNNVAKASV